MILWHPPLLPSPASIMQTLSWHISRRSAWLSTTVPDCMYYEATYDGDKKELRLDAYRKIQSVSIPC